MGNILESAANIFRDFADWLSSLGTGSQEPESSAVPDVKAQIEAIAGAEAGEIAAEESRPEPRLADSV